MPPRSPSPALPQAPARERSHELRQAWGLTPRQTEVLAALARGLSNKEIALELGCSPNTIEIHVGELLRRSGHASRGELLVSLLAWPLRL